MDDEKEIGDFCQIISEKSKESILNRIRRRIIRNMGDMAKSFKIDEISASWRECWCTFNAKITINCDTFDCEESKFFYFEERFIQKNPSVVHFSCIYCVENGLHVYGKAKYRKTEMV